ncbi:unnamed protein product [Rhizophagus irregularis]|nr:unnamed protein product [Rhizophagus irregularis]
MDLNIKNSYQEKVSSKSSPEIYTPPEKNPKDLLRRNDSSISFSTSSPFNDGSSSTDPFPQNHANETKTNMTSKKKQRNRKLKQKQIKQIQKITFKKKRAKFILISTARSFLQQSLPFRKTDAQRHLPIDINKSSKLWDWFTQTGWIKTGSNEIIQFNMN